MLGSGWREKRGCTWQYVHVGGVFRLPGTVYRDLASWGYMWQRLWEFERVSWVLKSLLLAWKLR